MQLYIRYQCTNLKLMNEIAVNSVSNLLVICKLLYVCHPRPYNNINSGLLS